MTSQRAEGHVGLGSHILYILVTPKFGGEIKLVNELEYGLAVQIRLPVALKV